MTNHFQLTETQKRRAYQNADKASLEIFYKMPASESRNLVLAWWERLTKTSSFKLGLFMHAEPINTAARLAQVDAIAIDESNEASYDQLLSRSRDRAMQRPGVASRAILQNHPKKVKAKAQPQAAATNVQTHSK